MFHRAQILHDDTAVAHVDEPTKPDWWTEDVEKSARQFAEMIIKRATVTDKRYALMEGFWILGGKAAVQKIGGGARVMMVRDSATISYVGGSATISDVGGSATISYVGDSATISYVRGSATITKVGTDPWDKPKITDNRVKPEAPASGGGA